MQPEQPDIQRTPDIILAPGHAFFVRLLELPPEMQPREVEAFARLSIESLSPFPPSQLAAGWHLWPEARRLLIFAAYRKSLSGTQAEWDAATLVAPEFAPALVFNPNREKPCLVLWQTADSIAGLLWQSGSKAPSQIALRRLKDDEQSASSVTWFFDRFGIAASTCDLLLWSPPPEGGLQIDGSGITAHTRPDPTTGATQVPLHLAPIEFESWDIRPSDFLEARRAERRNALLLWRGVLALLAILALLIVGEITHTLLGGWAGSRAKLLAQRAGDAQAVEDSDALAHRLQQLTQSQLRPFDKLDYIAAQLPDSVHFTRLVSSGLDTLTLDAIARNPGDVPILEGRLQQLPRIDKATAAGQQFRDNVTTFNLSIVFKPTEPGAEPAPAAPTASEPPAVAQEGAVPSVEPSPVPQVQGAVDETAARLAAEAAARAAEDTTTTMPAPQSAPPPAPEVPPGMPPDFTPPPPPPSNVPPGEVPPIP